jgi:glycosyltransferase involved in cell wall biosynthesis
MDVFALSSRSEGMPLAILEAWGSRLPVVASAVGGVPEMVEAGRTGLLFPSGDETALAEALNCILSNREVASRMAEEGRRQVVTRYSLARMAGDYERHYRALLA